MWAVSGADGQRCVCNGSEIVIVYHGTSLSNALSISREGFKVGHSTDAGRTGVFVIGPQEVDGILTLSAGFEHARDRAKNYLCTEWMKFDAPSSWSMGVVVAFRISRTALCKCDTIFNARKWVIQGPFF